MIILIVAGLAALIAIAVTVAVMENAQRSAWRRVAAERRHWEARQSDGSGDDPDRDDD